MSSGISLTDKIKSLCSVHLGQRDFFVVSNLADVSFTNSRLQLLLSTYLLFLFII